MATRFERQTKTTTRIEEELYLAPTSIVHHEQLLPALAPAHVPRQLPPRAIGGAMVAWLSLVFGVCYLALPLLFSAVGLSPGVLAAVGFSLPAFAMASVVALAGVLVVRPSIRLDWSGPRDPVVSAALGGLGVWAVVHNTTDLLLPFASMSGPQLASFLSLNVLEMSMLGMLFASFTKRHAVAFALGGGFQLLMMGLALTLMSLTLI